MSIMPNIIIKRDEIRIEKGLSNQPKVFPISKEINSVVIDIPNKIELQDEPFEEDGKFIFVFL